MPEGVDKFPSRFLISNAKGQVLLISLTDSFLYKQCQYCNLAFMTKQRTHIKPTLRELTFQVPLKRLIERVQNAQVGKILLVEQRSRHNTQLIT